MSASFFISTLVEATANGADADDLVGTGDTLLVTSSGELVSMSGGDGINAMGNDQVITLDGLAYSAFNSGVTVAGVASSLFVTGEAQSGTYAGISLVGQEDTADIGATGEVSGHDDGLYIFSGGSDTIINDGHITGTIFGVQDGSSGGNSLSNDGVISAITAIFVDVGTSDDSINNAGLVSGSVSAITVEGAQKGVVAEIANSGAIQGELRTDSASAVDIDNEGVWQGGTSGGALVLGASGNTLTNSGRIHASIDFFSGDNTLTNTGTIVGAIDFSGQFGSLTNGGEIHGNVTMAEDAGLTNTGTIHGDVLLGFSDSIDTSRGEITGVVTASNADTFLFSGSFGDVTIDDFAGTGPNHDFLSFAANDFGSFSAVQSDMSQVGSDVLIRLDATDTITLVDVKLAHVVAADFKFT